MAIVKLVTHEETGMRRVSRVDKSIAERSPRIKEYFRRNGGNEMHLPVHTRALQKAIDYLTHQETAAAELVTDEIVNAWDAEYLEVVQAEADKMFQHCKAFVDANVAEFADQAADDTFNDMDYALLLELVIAAIYLKNKSLQYLVCKQVVKKFNEDMEDAPEELKTKMM